MGYLPLFNGSLELVERFQESIEGIELLTTNIHLVIWATKWIGEGDFIIVRRNVLEIRETCLVDSIQIIRLSGILAAIDLSLRLSKVNNNVGDLFGWHVISCNLRDILHVAMLLSEVGRKS